MNATNTNRKQQLARLALAGDDEAARAFGRMMRRELPEWSDCKATGCPLRDARNEHPGEHPACVECAGDLPDLPF